MKLNPITALFDPIEKLINEHGSAAILRDHVALFRDQLAILKEKFTVLETENKTLKTENQNLKTENKQLKKKIETYEKSNHDNLLDKAKVKILQLLATLPHNDMLPLDSIMSDCNLSEQAARFHLQELEDEFMIESEYNNNITYWSIDHDGRRYLIKNKLIS